MTDNFRIVWPIKSYPVDVDYDLSLELLASLYEYAAGELTSENFPSDESGRSLIEIALTRFDISPTDEPFPPSGRVWRPGSEANLEMTRLGFRHATPKELLTLGLGYPNLVRFKSVVALGQPWLSSGEPSYLLVPSLFTLRDLCIGMAYCHMPDHETLLMTRFLTMVRI